MLTRDAVKTFILDDIISGIISVNFIYGYRSNQIVTKVIFRQISHKKKKSVNDVSTDFSVAGAVRFELTTRGFGGDLEIKNE